jgi:probable HAF family extracellular repeat protein
VGRHPFPTARRASPALYLALLTAVAAIGGLTPWILHSSSAEIDSPDDLALASVVPQSYRQGDGGPYSETDDTYISSGAPDTNFGANSKLLVDGAGCKISSTAVCKTLIKFPNFIGPNSGQVPAGSTVQRATLDLVITNKGWTQDVYQVTESWAETTATWNSFSPAGTPDTKPLDSVISPRSLGLFSIDITSIVQHWVNGEANQGIILSSTHSDGVDYESSESANPPALTVQFTAPAPPPGSPLPEFKIVDLGTLPGHDRSVAYAINNASQVVGRSCAGETTLCHAFLWDAGVMTDLGTLGGEYSVAYGINSAGQVVGGSWDASGSLRAFRWSDGVMIDLGDLGAGWAQAYDINDAGQVVGTSQPSGSSYHAFLWDAGVMTDLGTLGGSFSEAYGINDAGRVVGRSSFEGGCCIAFLWADGAMTNLGSLGGGLSVASDINDAGQVAGQSDNATHESRTFRWADGVMSDLGVSANHDENRVQGINGAGDVAGTRYGLGAFVWKDGVLTVLGGGFAYDINNADEVVGAIQERAVLWKPGSSPSRMIVDLGTLPGDAYSAAVKLNEARQVVGWSAQDVFGSPGNRRSFLWDDGVMTDLGNLGNPDLETMATDINEAGQVVGWSFISSTDQRAFLWENGEMRDLGVGNSSSAAVAINDAGQVAGWYYAYTSNPPYDWEFHVFLWQDGVTTDLGRVADADPGSPRNMGVTGLNNKGQIIGWSESIERHACDARAWLWENGAFTDLTNTSGCMALTESIANDINDAGQIAAWRGSHYEGPNRAYLWENGTWTALLPPNAEGNALGINNRGQIVGGFGGGPFISETDRTITVLPDGFPPSFSSGASDLNEAGDVVGSAVPDGSDRGQHAVMWTMTAPISGPATLTFQKGDGGAYSETDDTYISSGLPNANYGAGVALYVDASGCKVSAATVCKALIRFPNVIGSSDGQVKAGSVIVSAILQLEITNPGGTQMLYQLTEGWTESGATWNGFTTPGAPTTKGAAISFNAPLGVITVNITAIVQNWVNGDANYGVLIWSSSTDGVDYRSSESVNPPKLIVTFRSP